MQATVLRYDSETRSGTVVRDDGTEIAFGATALEGTGLRLLRAGQRVRLDVSGTGDALHVERLQILTLS
ncbi:cold-shock protein [Nocardioides mesophilus]|uniref:Cold-shock protein n=1 Tax=Nocardioides mesophilus TaxID=433659 RepID=A0A7G9R912_9ACTN|nr:cold-shock protein [Nocardioides mesophilus]QNN52087.1 cold-shock protein [Nocardioides mesophilus]